MRRSNGRIAACEAIDCQCTDDDGCIEQCLGAKQAIECERQAELRAIDQCQSFLRFEREGGKSGGFADGGTFEASARPAALRLHRSDTSDM